MELNDADKLLELFTLRVQQGVQQITKTVQDAADKQRAESSLEIQRLEMRVVAQVTQVREEQRRELTEIKDDTKQIQTDVAETAKRVGQIETRLDEGDKKFQQHEARITALEAEAGKAGKGLAAIGGALGVGGGIGAALASYLK